MSAPIIFSGSYAKLLTPKGILNSDGSINNYDGAKNYIPYGEFEQGLTTGWSLFNTTLTSGLPTGSVTAGAASLALTATSTNPLSGSYSMQLAAGTSWTAGQGVISSSFTVDRADLGKVLTFKFYYEATAGATNANWSGILGSQSLAVYIYDVTASAWIQPAGFLGMNQNSGAGYVTGTFQTSVTSGQQYQIAIVALQAVANPLTITVDQVFVGPQTAPIGAVVTDWQSYTPTVTYSSGGATNVIHYGRWRRVGDSIEIETSSVFSGASAAFSRPIYSVPSGLTIDTSKNTGSVVGAITDEVVGISRANDSVSNAYIGMVALNSTTTFFPYVTAASTTYGSYADITNLIPFTIGSGDSITSIVRLPIVGWSSTVQTSNTTDTRIVDFIGTYTASQSVTANVTNFSISSVVKDTHGAFSSTTYTVPVSGDYLVSCSFLSNTAASTATLYKNTVNTGYVGASVASANYAGGGSMLVTCNAGDTLTIRSTQSATISSFYLSIHRLSGPSVIAATDTVAASYWCSANVSASTTQPINFDSKEFDLTNSVTVGSGWKFTCPVSGTYNVAGLTAIVGGTSNILIYKNGSVYKMLYQSNVTGNYGSGSTNIKLNAGDYIDLRPDGAKTIYGGALNTALTATISIVRVGN